MTTIVKRFRGMAPQNYQMNVSKNIGIIRNEQFPHKICLEYLRMITHFISLDDEFANYLHKYTNFQIPEKDSLTSWIHFEHSETIIIYF